MKKFVRFTVLLALGTMWGVGFAQSSQSFQASQGEVVVVTVLGATYPSLARQANITGDVEVRLDIRKDGSVQSEVVVTGHPMLAPAALKSAKQTRFECRGCEGDVTAYSVIYSFQILASVGWPCPRQAGPMLRNPTPRNHYGRAGHGVSGFLESKIPFREMPVPMGLRV